jgi:hypothetical protein
MKLIQLKNQKKSSILKKGGRDGKKKSQKKWIHNFNPDCSGFLFEFLSKQGTR